MIDDTVAKLKISVAKNEKIEVFPSSHIIIIGFVKFFSLLLFASPLVKTERER